MISISNSENSAALKRRLKIIIGYLILGGTIALIIYLIKAPAATCFDKIQNQGEKGVDCGGPCSPCKEISQTKDLAIEETAFAPGGDNAYDVVSKISNPNDSVGASSFDYVFNLKDASGKVIATGIGTSFILPSDTRYVAKLGLAVDSKAVPVSVDFSISNVIWGKLANIGKPQLGVYNKNFGSNMASEGIEADGVIRNESSYDLKKIEAVILLRNDKGRIIAINTTERDSIRAGQEQNFQVTWPYLLGTNVQKVEVDTQTNVFDPQNFSVPVYQ
jgi:hypothetical protein